MRPRAMKPARARASKPPLCATASPVRRADLGTVPGEVVMHCAYPSAPSPKRLAVDEQTLERAEKTFTPGRETRQAHQAVGKWLSRVAPLELFARDWLPVGVDDLRRVPRDRL